MTELGEIEVVAAAFWSRVDVRGPDDCWLWTMSRQPRGYAQWAPPRQTRLAGGRRTWWLVHRLAWFLTYGPIPPGWTVDHECHNRSGCLLGRDCWHRRCCNPAHFRLARLADNCAARPSSPVCPAGHEVAVHGRRSNGQCRECSRVANREAMRRKLADPEQRAALNAARRARRANRG